MAEKKPIGKLPRDTIRLLELPRLPTANTNIPTMMIAEKLGDALLSSRKFA